MECELQEKEALPEKTENTIRDTIYAVGIDQRLNLKERIADVHGTDSEVMTTVKQLDDFLSKPDPIQNAAAMELRDKAKSILNQSTNKKEQTKAKKMIDRSHKLLSFENRPEVRKFTGSVSRRIPNRRMAEEIAAATINEGYIVALRRLACPGAQQMIAFAKEYARNHEMSLPASLLFGYNGSAYYALVDWIVQEKAHGMHRPGRMPHPLWRQETQDAWRDANRTCNWPIAFNSEGEEDPYVVTTDEAHLPEGMLSKLRKIWRCNPALRNYMGIFRLSGDLPYQIIEDIFDIVICRRLSSADRARYNQIMEEANRQGIEPFYAVYKNLFANKDRLKPYWNRARKLLYDYSICLWETKNEIWLAEGKREPARGIVFKAKNIVAAKPRKNKVPGTIYLNNGGYYWCVARKMKPRPLIDTESKPKIPGSFLVSNGRYYWHIPRWVKRKRLVPKGEKFSTKDKATAFKIAKKLWNQIKKNDPELAANIQKHTRVNGMATKDRAVAEKVAVMMWKQIQKKSPKLAAKILTGNRPRAKDHWHAQFCSERHHRFLGSFKTQADAEAAYVKEFEKVWGYPPGYDVQCMPKIDNVWPTWTEEKARLALMDEHPQMPVIGKSAESLKPMLGQMQKVDWLVNNCIVVLDDNCPVASKEVAIQSRGEKWYAEIKKQGKRPVIKGSTSIDKDTGRAQITIYGQGFSESRVLTEEIYHIVFEIVRHASPRTFASIKKWYSNRLKHYLDPTWMIHEAFAELMVQEAEFPESTDLPRNVVNYAQRVFSDRNIVPKWAMKKVMPGV